MVMKNITELHQTGSIWTRSPRNRAQIVRRVCEALMDKYASPRLGNPLDPVDDLIFIILSNRTSPELARYTYERLKKRFSSLESVISSPVSTLKTLLKPAGLYDKKSRQIRTSLKIIKNDFGTIDLSSLKNIPPGEVEGYLTSLPGVSKKVAKCVMLYTLGFDVLPVDGHVHRISKRLGWTRRKRADQCHDELEALIPFHRRYAFHVDCILHGRTVCRPKTPKCNVCIIRKHCECIH